MTNYGVRYCVALLLRCPVCRAAPHRKCMYTAGAVAGNPMSLLHDSRYLEVVKQKFVSIA